MPKQPKAKKVKQLIDLDELAILLVGQANTLGKLDGVEYIVHFLVHTFHLSSVQKLLMLLKGTCCYNRAACEYIQALLDVQNDEMLEQAREDAFQFQTHIQSDDPLYPCHPYAELHILIACTTQRPSDTGQAREVIMKRGSDLVKADGLLRLYAFNKRIEDRTFIRSAISAAIDAAEPQAKTLAQMTKRPDDLLLYANCVETLLFEEDDEGIAAQHIDEFIDTARKLPLSVTNRVRDQIANRIMKMRLNTLDSAAARAN